MPTENLKSGLSISSLVLSIIGALLCLSVIGIVFGIPVSIIALVFGIIALVQKQQKSMAVAGVIISGIFIVFTSILLVIGVNFLKKNADILIDPANEIIQMIKNDPELTIMFEDPEFENELQYLLRNNLIANINLQEIKTLEDIKSQISIITQEIQNTILQLKQKYQEQQSQINSFEESQRDTDSDGDGISEAHEDGDGQIFINGNTKPIEKEPIKGDIYSCQIDEDCIPLPSECHPMSCINKSFESNYTRPEMCTMVFMSEAAYNDQDCICQQNICINKNLGTTDIQ